MPSATDVLREEHQTIKRALGFAEKIASKVDQEKEVSSENLGKLMEFIRLFVEQCHHSKEEEILFPLLEKKDIPAFGGPVGVMLMEHDRARVLIQQMTSAASEGISRDSAKRWSRAAWDYSDLMYEHFYKEEEMLFKMADRVLDVDEQASVVAAFERLETEKIGPGRHYQLRSMMMALISQNP